MCNSKNYCSARLTRMLESACSRGDDVRASQVAEQLASNDVYSEPRDFAITSALPVFDGTIAVDLDDTVGSFTDDMRLALARRDGLSFAQALERYPLNPPNGIASWWSDQDDPDAYSYQQFEDVEQRGLLYRDQPVRRHAGRVLNRLDNAYEGRVKFLTARPSAYNDISETWLKERVGVRFPIEIANSTRKELVDGYDVLIDDSVPHVHAVTAPDAPHGPRNVIFMTRTRSDSRVPESPYIHRAWSWNAVEELLTTTA